MDESRRNVMVGLFVLLGLGALGMLIVMFGQVPTALMQHGVYPVKIRFDSVAGIREGTLVTVRGKTIGRVRRVEFAEPSDLSGGVHVIVAIEDGYKLPDDSAASTTEAGLIAGGRPPIEIQLGRSVAMLTAESPPIRGTTVDAMSTLLPADIFDNFNRTAGELGSAAAALRPVLADLQVILKPRTPGEVDAPGGPQGNLSSAAARLDSALKHVNALVGDAERIARIDAVIANAETMSSDGRVLFSDLREAGKDVRGAVQRADAVIANAGESLTRLDRRVDDVSRVLIDDLNQAGDVLHNLNTASALAANGDGTLGKLLRDDRLYESLIVTSRRLAEAFDELRLLAQEWQKGKIRIGF